MFFKHLIPSCPARIAPLAMALTATAAAQQAKPADDLTAPPQTLSINAPPKAVPATPALPDVSGLIDFSRVYFQTTADGSLYAAGRTYKAKFDGDSLTFVPRGGEKMSFALQSATVGAKALPITSDALPIQNGNSVSIDRGAFVERYSLTPESVEQTFVINQLPQHGDLVLKIAATAPSMIATEKSASLEFRGDHGAVNFTKAVLVDNTDAHTNLPTSFSGGMIEIRVPASALDRAQFPIVIDPVITTDIAFTATGYRHADVAYDASNNRFVLVAEYDFAADDGDVYSVLLDVNGVPVPNTSEGVDVTTVNWRKPSVANNNIANRFMVVAEAGDAPTRGIWGCTISAATGNLLPQFEIIAGGGGEKTNPDIGGDSFLVAPTYFLVVWEWAFTPTDHNIAGRMLDANGAMVGSNLFLELGNKNQSKPAVSKSNLGNEWMVVWQHSFSAADEDLYGAQVLWDGTITAPSAQINTSSVNHELPDVSSPLPSGQYLVVYEHTGAVGLGLVDDTMFVQQLTTLGNIGNNPFGQARWQPTADCDGSKFVVGYSETYNNNSNDWDLYADTLCVDVDHLRLSEYHKNLNYQINRDQSASVATTWSGGGVAFGPAVFAWTHNAIAPSDLGQISAGRYNAHSSCCPTDIAPLGGNGIINIDDLLAIISGWTGLSTCSTCQADTNGDLMVNIDDLLRVINTWGACQ